MWKRLRYKFHYIDNGILPFRSSFFRRRRRRWSHFYRWNLSNAILKCRFAVNLQPWIEGEKNAWMGWMWKLVNRNIEDTLESYTKQRFMLLMIKSQFNFEMFKLPENKIQLHFTSVCWLHLCHFIQFLKP